MFNLMAMEKQFMVAYIQSKAREQRFKVEVCYQFQAQYSIFLKGSNTMRELHNLEGSTISWIYTTNSLTKQTRHWRNKIIVREFKIRECIDHAKLNAEDLTLIKKYILTRICMKSLLSLRQKMISLQISIKSNTKMILRLSNLSQQNNQAKKKMVETSTTMQIMLRLTTLTTCQNHDSTLVHSLIIYPSLTTFLKRNFRKKKLW